MKIQLRFEFEKETKGTVKYQERDTNGDRGHSFYLLKSALPENNKYPAFITMTIEDE